jgi:hypothetical protein
MGRFRLDRVCSKHVVYVSILRYRYTLSIAVECSVVVVAALSLDATLPTEEKTSFVVRLFSFIVILPYVILRDQIMRVWMQFIL